MFLINRFHYMPVLFIPDHVFTSKLIDMINYVELDLTEKI